MNLIIAIIFPFLMDGFLHSRFLILIQSVCIILMVVLTFLLLERMMVYYDAGRLSNLILKDYADAVKNNSKGKMAENFTQFVDLSKVLLASADDALVVSVYSFLSEYVVQKCNEKKYQPCQFDDFFYDGISRINDNICIAEQRPISINKGSSILNLLIFNNSEVAETSYSCLWRNLLVQLHYKRDEWIMEYWTVASQKYDLTMNKVSTFDINEDTGVNYTEKEVFKNDKLRDEFLEFHIMLCAMLVQQGKYNLIEQILSFTQSQPETYPLIPSKMDEIIDLFQKLHKKIHFNPFYFEQRYQMPNMYGITQGKILSAASCYLAILVYRLYSINWYFGEKSILTSIMLPDNLLDLSELNTNLDELKFWIEKVKLNKTLNEIDCVANFENNFDKKLSGLRNTDLQKPLEFIAEMTDNISKKMDRIRVSQPHDPDLVNVFTKRVGDIITQNMVKYHKFIGDRKIQGKSYDLTSSTSQNVPSLAFQRNSDIGCVGFENAISGIMLQRFSYLFAKSFYEQCESFKYQISSDDLFLVI
ncbi:MAG: hypothetical protein ACRDCN_03480, partial [Tannerellaceae bacterium]